MEPPVGCPSPIGQDISQTAPYWLAHTWEQSQSDIMLNLNLNRPPCATTEPERLIEAQWICFFLQEDLGLWYISPYTRRLRHKPMVKGLYYKRTT